MKKTILIITMALSFVGLNQLNAQKQNFERGANQRLEKLQQELDLTETQTEQINYLQDEFRIEMQEMRSNESLTHNEFVDAIKQKREEHQNEIRNLLTEEQLLKFDALSQKRQDRKFSNGPKHGRHSSLTDEQLCELKEKRIEFDEELSANEKEIIAEFRLKREERQFENKAEMKKDGTGPRHGHRGFKGDREEMKPMFEIAENHKESLMVILDEYRPERPEECTGENRERKGGKKAGKGRGPEAGAIHFLLMDTETVDMGNVDEQSMDVSIFPNPARNLVNISYDLPNEGKVTIELLDKNGNALELIEQSYQNKGQNEVTFDAAILVSGEMYFIKVSSDQGEQVDKFIKM